MKNFIGKKVNVKNIQSFSKNQICPQEFKIVSLDVIDIPVTTLQTTTTSTSSTTSTTIPIEKTGRDYIPIIVVLLLVITISGFVLIFVKVGGPKLMKKTHLEKAKSENILTEKIVDPPKRMGGIDGNLPDKKEGSTLEEA